MRILFDIGATHLRLAPETAEGVGETIRIDTPEDPNEAVARFVEAAAALGQAPAAIGGIPAIVEDGSVLHATNLPHWNGFPFAEALAHALGVPVFVRNDAELAGLGEAVYGAGKGVERMAYIGIGTGVGVSFIAGGAIVPHASDEGRAKVITLADGSSLEERIGGRSILERYGEPPEALAPEDWSLLAPYLAEGIRTALSLWAPDSVVLGGSLMGEQGFSLRELAQLVPEADLRAAALGDASGLYGAKAWGRMI